MKVLNTVMRKGFDLNQSLTIIKRINKHLNFCMENKQNYDETLFYVKQDFNFKDIESIMIECMEEDEVIYNYFDANC